MGREGGGCLWLLPKAVGLQDYPRDATTGSGGGRRLYVLDAVAGLDVDVLPVEDSHRVGREGLVEHGEDLGGDIIHGDVHVGHEGRVRALQVLVYKIMELSRVPSLSSAARHFARGNPQVRCVLPNRDDILDACGTTADDGEVEEFAAGLIGCNRCVSVRKKTTTTIIIRGSVSSEQHSHRETTTYT